MIFEPFTIRGITFKNRILRSSIGGRTAYYDGTVSTAWKNFEKRFAAHGVGGIISATISIDDRRYSPLEYPKLSHDRYIPAMRSAIAEVKRLDCRYILQIGDPGVHTQASLFSQGADAKSASSGGVDFLYGYRSVSEGMTVEEIAQTVDNFAEAARRAREIGADGLEITASKGYLLHQFLNPATNRREDEYGGSPEKRLRLLEEVVRAVRAKIGGDFLFGVRLSAADYNHLPVNLRWPPVWPLRDYFFGNGVETMLGVGKKLKDLGVDYLHITSGYGFINPRETPGDYPLDEIRMFANSTRHLGAKANFRAAVLNFFPDFLLRPILGRGFRHQPGINVDYAARFREEIGIPVIANGGFQERDLIEETLSSGKADLVAMARPLLANPDLIQLFKAGKGAPDKPCTHCNRCAVRTAAFPLGCYDPSRFSSQDEMEQQILRWSASPDEVVEEAAAEGTPLVD